MNYHFQNAVWLNDHPGHKGRYAFHLLVLVVLCIAVSPARAGFDETYKLTVGGLITDFETSLRINSRDNSIDEKIKLEDDLGFDSTVQSAWIRGFWRMAPRHRLSLLYTRFSRSSEAISTTDIEVDGNIIEAGAFVSSSSKTHLFDIEYTYSFYKRPNIELGISAGLYWMNSVFELAAAGEVIFEGETQPEFRGDYQADQRLIAPLPLIGLTLDYEFNEKWRLNAGARFFDVTISDIDGYIFSSSLGAEYYFTNHVGLGAALAWFDLSVKYNGVVLINTLEYEYAGAQVYLSLKY